MPKQIDCCELEHLAESAAQLASVAFTLSSAIGGGTDSVRAYEGTIEMLADQLQTHKTELQNLASSICIAPPGEL